MSLVLQGFLFFMSGVLALAGGYFIGLSLYILRSRDPFAPREFVGVALPFGVVAIVLGGLASAPC